MLYTLSYSSGKLSGHKLGEFCAGSKMHSFENCLKRGDLKVIYKVVPDLDEGIYDYCSLYPKPLEPEPD